MNDNDDFVYTFMSTMITALFTIFIVTAPVWVAYYCILLFLYYFFSINPEEFFNSNHVVPIGILTVLGLIQLFIFIKYPELNKIITAISVIIALILICTGLVQSPWME